MEKIIQKLEDLARKIKYGSLTLDITISRGRIVKIVIGEQKETILLDK